MTTKKIVALTGGIGSGKSFVAHKLTQRGIKVYDCDTAAKRLMTSSKTIRQQLLSRVGEQAYIGEKLNKAAIANYLLAAESNRRAINEIVHPAVAEDFLMSDMEWIESAILFDSGFDKRLPIDYIICVVAPVEVRISRIMARDDINRHQAEEWINQQMSQEECIRRSDLIVNNDGICDIDEQIDKILKTISLNKNN